MTEATTWHTQWANVDHSADPEAFVRFMDGMRARDATAAQHLPRMYFGSLELEPGHHVLEVGSGTGDEVRWMAPLVGSTGRVVGIDNSQLMTQEARRRAAGLELPVEFHQGDAYALAFADASFDRCRAVHTLSALTEPERALAEMARVTRPGGRVVVIDQDWETLIIDAADHRVTRRVRDLLSESFPCGWVGRRLPGLFKSVGLTDLVVRTGVSSWTDHNPDDPWWQATVRHAQDVGAISPSEATAWLADLRQRAASDRYFAAVMVFNVIGRKPEETNSSPA